MKSCGRFLINEAVRYRVRAVRGGGLGPHTLDAMSQSLPWGQLVLRQRMHII
jgi:hypothetical protein